MFLLVFRLIGDYVIGCMCASCWLAIKLVLGGPLVGLYPEDFSQLVNSQTVREWADSFGLDSVCSKSCETMWNYNNEREQIQSDRTRVIMFTHGPITITTVWWRTALDTQCRSSSTTPSESPKLQGLRRIVRVRRWLTKQKRWTSRTSMRRRRHRRPRHRTSVRWIKRVRYQICMRRRCSTGSTRIPNRGLLISRDMLPADSSRRTISK